MSFIFGKNKRAKHFTNEIDFTFDAEVAGIFDNMAERSIPYYWEINRLCASLSHMYYINKTRPYKVLDIGASTGNFFVQFCNVSGHPLSSGPPNFRGTAIDLSENMLAKLEQKVPWVDTVICDVSEGLPPDLSDFDLIVCNFTLQFLPEEVRGKVLSSVYEALAPGGIFLLAEKCRVSSDFWHDDFNIMYHARRLNNGYTLEEVYAKIQSLKSVMKCTTLEDSKRSLLYYGFQDLELFFKWVNFYCLCCVKPYAKNEIGISKPKSASSPLS